MDKTLIVEEGKHKSPPSERPKEEAKQTITIPADETFWEWTTRTPKKAVEHDCTEYLSIPRRTDLSSTTREGKRRATMKRTSAPPWKGRNQERESACQ